MIERTERYDILQSQINNKATEEIKEVLEVDPKYKKFLKLNDNNDDRTELDS